jgi:hypothetical protein
MHWQAGIMVAWVLGETQKTPWVYALAVVVVLAISVADRALIGKPVSALRNRVKQKLSARAALH